jgi:spore coat protein U-like protein
MKTTKRAQTGLLAAICLGFAPATEAANCSFAFKDSSLAQLLSLTSATPQRIQVGTITQNCSGNGSYSLVIASANCVSSPSGAKLIEPNTRQFVGYTVEFDNPTTGGSLPVVSGLLARICSCADGRDVAWAKISHESSAVYINFTGSNLLAAGTYSDTLSVTLNMN